MRRREYTGSEAEGRELFATAEVLHLAGVSEDGQPVFRALDGVVDDGWVCFHGAPAGEKTSLLGRPVVLSVEEPVAHLPSYFSDPERACPATTLYRSAQVRGVLTAIDEPARKARVLQRLMEKLQPEGGYAPLDAGSPLYRAQVNGLLIAGVPLDGVACKVKLAQNKTPEQRRGLVERLWQRGRDGDPRAIELMLAANGDAPPPFLRVERAPGVRLHAWLPETRVEEAVALLKDVYWNVGTPVDALRAAQLGSSAWLGATDEAGALIATARAISDGGKHAWVYDVAVREDWRRRGIGDALVRLLLDHPRVRGARRVHLGTNDAESLYRRMGFVAVGELPPKPYVTVQMMLCR